MSEKKLHFETLQQHAGQVPDPGVCQESCVTSNL